MSALEGVRRRRRGGVDTRRGEDGPERPSRTERIRRLGGADRRRWT